MPARKRLQQRRPRTTSAKPIEKQPQPAPPDPAIERDPAVEWGEGIFTGKIVARAGKATGFVPGATESKPGKDEKN